MGEKADWLNRLVPGKLCKIGQEHQTVPPFTEMSFTKDFFALPSSIQELVRLLVSEALPEQVILFGSRAQGTHRPNSDFDIAVAGRKAHEGAWNRLVVGLTEDPITLYNVDLVEFEKLGPAYQAHILKEGKLLYG